MNLKQGYISSINDNYIKVIVPYHIWAKKYKKLLITVKKYLIKNKGYYFALNDKVLLNLNKKQIIKII